LSVNHTEPTHAHLHTQILAKKHVNLSTVPFYI